MLSSSHERFDDEDIGDIDMSRRVQTGRGMIRRYLTSKLALVIHTPKERRVNGEFTLGYDRYHRLGSGGSCFRRSGFSRTKDHRFFERKFEAAKDDGMHCV